MSGPDVPATRTDINMLQSSKTDCANTKCFFRLEKTIIQQKRRWNRHPLCLKQNLSSFSSVFPRAQIYRSLNYDVPAQR